MKELYPVAASEFIEFDETDAELLKLCGGIPTNDRFVEIWNLLWDVLLLYGGRGGGKSESVADVLLKESLTEEYFKCYYGRKVFDSVRGSSFATLISCIKKNSLEDHFSYSDSPQGHMVIECRDNGNLLIPFGSDQPNKLKSIKDPTHIWCEEFDQFSFEDFKELFPTLRTLRGQNKFIGSFNAYAVLPNHWIIKLFFPEQYIAYDKTEEVIDETVLSGQRIKKIFVNYIDNYFIDQEKYRQVLWLSSAGSYTIFKGLADGAFGVMQNDSPWAYAFGKEKHVSNGITIAHPVLNRKHPVYLSFDFNRNPMCCNIIQWYDNTVFVLEVIKIMNAGIDAVCERIKRDYYGCLYIVTGDYSGNAKSSLYQQQVSHYILIKQYLNISESQFKVLPNPHLKDNSALVNSILAYYTVVIHVVKAAPLIFDMENVRRLADGSILKQDREDPAQQSDCFTGDTMILTDNGEVRMDCIEIGDKVLTRNGYKSVIDKWDSVADVYEFEFSDGTKINCTKDHKFYTNSFGFISIFRIFNDNLSVWKTKSFTTDTLIPNIQGNHIITQHVNRKKQVYIGKNGLTHLVKYLKDMMYIIKTTIRSIMILTIWDLFKKVNIKATTQRNVLRNTPNRLINGRKLELLLHLNGIDQKRVLNGISNMQSIAILDTETTEIENAIIAKKNLSLNNQLQNFVPITVNQHGEEKTNLIKKLPYVKHVEKNLKHSNIFLQNTVQKNVNPLQTHTEVKVKRMMYVGKRTVYDITVEYQHEFYANNILVHNCLDGFRYFCNAFLSWFKPETMQTYINASVPKNLNGHSNIVKETIVRLNKAEYIECTKDEYVVIRPVILDQSNKWIVSGDKLLVENAISEVRRLDEMFQ